MSTSTSEFITHLGVNAARGVTVGPWRLYYDETSGCFYWARGDAEQREPTWPLVWATPYWGEPARHRRAGAARGRRDE